MLFNINLLRSKGMNGRPRGQEVKGQGHRRRKLYLEVNKNIENALSCSHKDKEKNVQMIDGGSVKLETGSTVAAARRVERRRTATTSQTQPSIKVD